jgi:hypothetical protein
MTAVPGTNAFVSTSVHGLQLYRGSAVSYDAGQTWTEIENTANKAVCRFFDAETGYAGGFFVTGPPLRGGIFKSEIVFATPVAPAINVNPTQRAVQQDEASSANLVKLYPSPASDVVNVILEDAMLNRQTAISIINSEGRVVETRNSMGSRSIQLNVARLVPGLYIVRIASGSKMINKAITIVR